MKDSFKIYTSYLKIKDKVIQMSFDTYIKILKLNIVFIVVQQYTINR